MARRVKKSGTPVLHSMTGYGVACVESETISVEVEIKATNSRFLDLIFRLPRAYNSFEGDLRSEIARAVERGRLEISVNRQQKKSHPVKVNLNEEAFLALKKVYSNVGKELGCKPEELRAIVLSQVLARSEVLEISQNTPDVTRERTLLMAALVKALSAFEAMRAQEGAHLEQDILARLKKLGIIRKKVAELASKKPEQVKERLLTALKRLAGETQLDSSRLHAEIAVLADKVDVTEELVRLDSHFVHFESLLAAPPAGKKLDFLVQELLREFNTIGSKAQDAEVQANVIEAKSEIEKIREQVQNLE